MSKRAVVVLSGGQDSTTCLYLAKSAGFECHAVTFDYDQRHNIEIDAARRVAKLAAVASHEIITLGPVLKGSSPLVSSNPLEQYRDYTVLPGGIEKTFVPMRNQLFLTIAANRAFALQTNVVITGVCEEDYGGYPDCRRGFIDALEHACNLGTFADSGHGQLLIKTPLMRWSKAETVRRALLIAGCYEALAHTHTSYDGEFPPTGHDHATLLRAKGFAEAGVPDPLVLRAYLLGLMDLPEESHYKMSEQFNQYLERVASVLHVELHEP